MAKKKKNKSKGVVDADGKRWYNSIDPGIDTSWGSAIYNGPGILFRLVTGVKRDEFSPEYEENLWKAYTMGWTDGLPKSNVRFDGEDLGDADVVGLPQEQAVIVQSIADTLYAKQIRDKVRNKMYSSPGEDEAMRRKAIEYQDVAEKILNSPGEWVSIREGSSPVREFKKVGKREVGFTGLGGLKNFDVRWNPKESTLDVRDEYDFKDEGVEGNIPRRDRRLFIRDRIKFYPEKGGVFYRNPKKVEEMGYRSRFEEGGIVGLKPEDGISLYYVPVMDDGGNVEGNGNPGFWEKVGNTVDAVIHPRDAAYRIMKSSRGKSSIGFRDVFDIIVNRENGHYFDQEDGNSFDYPHMYIYGEAEGAEELSDEDKKYGVDYSSYIKSIGRDPDSIKQYKGNFGSDIVLPESYKSIVDDMINSGNNKTIGYETDTQEGDDVAGHLGRINKDKDGNYIISYSDMWDFDPGSYTDKWGSDGGNFRTWIQSYMLDKAGTPFIVRSNKSVKFISDDEYDAEILRLLKDGSDLGKYSYDTVNAIDEFIGESKDWRSNHVKYNFSDAINMITTPFRKAIRRDNGGEVASPSFSNYASRDNTSVGGPGIDANANYGQRVSPQFNIGEVIANFTPVVGDAVDVKDLIESYSNRDWLGMGLAAAGFIPIGGDLLQEYNKLRRRKFLDEIPIKKGSGNEDLHRRREDIDETDEELLDKMPSYAHPQSPNTNMFVLHKLRLDNGAYERITGRLRNDFIRNARDLDQLYPGIYKRIFDIDNMSVDDEDLDAFLEMFYMRDKGSFSGLSKEMKMEYLDNAKDKVFNESPMYKIGLDGDNAIAYGRNSFIDKFGNENLDGRISAGLSHELDHAVKSNASKEYLDKMSKEADRWFDDDLVRESGRSTFSDRMELAARGSQIKDYFGLVDDAQEVTPEMLKYAARNYDTRWMDNNMLDFFSGIKDWDKAAKWITKYSTVTLPAAAIPYFVDESKSEYENGGEIDRKFNLKELYNLGDYIQPENGSSKYIGYQPFYSVPFFYKRVKYIENKLNKDYGFSPYEAEDAVFDIIPKSMLDDGYYDVKNNTYGIGQWGGDDLKRFKAMYDKGGLDDQIDFLAKEYKKKNGGSINNMDDLYRYLRSMHVKKEGGLVEKQDELYSTLTEDYGMKPIQAIAVIANLTHESNLDETILGDSGASLGLQQWKGERRDALESFAFAKGHPVPTFDDQIEFLMNEYNSGQAFQFNSKGQNLYATGKTKNPTFDYYQYSKDDFNRANNLYDAVIAWNQGVGRPSKKYAYNDRRYNIAKRIADRHGIKYSNKSYFGEMGMNPEWVDVDAVFTPAVSSSGVSGSSRTPVDGGSRVDSVSAGDSTSGSGQVPPQGTGESVLSGEEMFMQQYGNAIVQQMLAADMKYTRINDQSSELAKRQKEIASDARKESESIRESEQQRREREFLASILPSIQLNVKGVSRN